MTAAELIAALQKMDPGALVVVTDYARGGFPLYAPIRLVAPACAVPCGNLGVRVLMDAPASHSAAVKVVALDLQ